MKKIIIVIVLIFLGYTSCDSGFEDLNVNPNAADVLEPGPKFTNAILRAAEVVMKLAWQFNLFFHDDPAYGFCWRCLGRRQVFIQCTMVRRMV